MLLLPKKRILVYLTAGLVVAVVGTAGLLAGRGDGAGGQVVISALQPSTASATAGGQAAGGAGSTSTSAPPARIYVQVAGAVRRPGVYQVPAGARVFQVIQQAGGFTEDAAEEAVPLASKLSDGCRVFVPRLGEVTEGASGELVLSVPLGGEAQGAEPLPVNLNTATLEQLQSLPGIGPALAQRIITYREEHGPFTSLDQLLEVPGIGQTRLEQLRPLVSL